MTVTIAALDDLQFGDLGDAIVDELEKRLGYMQDRDAKYLAAFVTLLDSAGIAGRLATMGSDGTKSLVGRTRGRAGQLAAYEGKAAPGWLYTQTRNDVLATVRAAQSAGLDTKAYLDATISIVSASAPTSSPAAPVATVTPKGVPTSGKARTTVAPSTAVLVQAPTVPEEPMYAPGATDIHPPASFRFWRTVKAYALPITIVGVGAVAAVAIAVLERRKRPAVAGFGGVRGGCGKAPRRYSLAALKRKRTISSGQGDSLKVDSGCHRVWLSRMTTADGAPYNNQVTVERLVRGRWKTVKKYQAR